MNFVQCMHDLSIQNGLIISQFLAGLAGGFTHCSAMCGPFVLAQSSKENYKDTKISRLSDNALITYHFGRMTTYVVLAALFHSVFNLALLFSGHKILLTAPILMLAGVLFLISVFPAMQQVFPWAAKIRLGAVFNIIGKFSAPLLNNPGVFKRYLLGVMLGFMPCTLVVAALMAVSTAPTLLQAVLAMTAFTLGTIPALILLAFGGRQLQSRFPNAAHTIKQSLMAMSALWLFVLAGWMMI